MKRRSTSTSRALQMIFGLLISVATPGRITAEPQPAAVAAFNSYVHAVESRLSQQHQSQSAFLAPIAPIQESDNRLRGGDLIIDQRTPSGGLILPGALLHHWRATAFAPGAKAADFEKLLQDFNSYPEKFSPQVVQARVLVRNGDHLQARMRVRQHHVITVLMDTTYDVSFVQLDPQHGYSTSRSTQISELDSSGAAVDPGQDHGYLWRQNTYWSYEERDGGLYIQVESVSLTRTVPAGLGWVVGPFVETIPRESLEFTLRSACAALRSTVTPKVEDLHTNFAENREGKQG